MTTISIAAAVARAELGGLKSMRADLINKYIGECDHPDYLTGTMTMKKYADWIEGRQRTIPGYDKRASDYANWQITAIMADLGLDSASAAASLHDWYQIWFPLAAAKTMPPDFRRFVWQWCPTHRHTLKRLPNPAPPEHAAPDQLYRWHWRARLPERRGELFRVLARGKMNSCLIEFLSDGVRHVTSRNALRRA